MTDTQAFHPFHEGEIAIQERLGIADRMDRFGRKTVRPFMPDQHRDFYRALPMIFVGHVDGQGWPWASILVGKPGFISSESRTSLGVAAKPAAGDPLSQSLAAGLDLGLLGIELSNRRRNRMNGKVTRVDANSFAVTVDQAFGNCPQYIQVRHLNFVRDPQTVSTSTRAFPSNGLDENARAMIGKADTFFVATASGQTEAGDSRQGADVSHRGGKAGFVKVDGNRLTVPDYAGNKHFNTMGNMLLNPKAGLLFVDFETGDVLMVSGSTEILWDEGAFAHFKGAERAWAVDVQRAILIKDALPVRWAFQEYSPNSLVTGSWEEAAAVEAAGVSRD